MDKRHTETGTEVKEWGTEKVSSANTIMQLGFYKMRRNS
jgi:hypothetical protein